jgi:hypothetical protein
MTSPPGLPLARDVLAGCIVAKQPSRPLVLRVMRAVGSFVATLHVLSAKSAPRISLCLSLSLCLSAHQHPGPTILPERRLAARDAFLLFQLLSSGRVFQRAVVAALHRALPADKAFTFGLRTTVLPSTLVQDAERV